MVLGVCLCVCVTGKLDLIVGNTTCVIDAFNICIENKEKIERTYEEKLIIYDVFS